MPTHKTSRGSNASGSAGPRSPPPSYRSNEQPVPVGGVFLQSANVSANGGGSSSSDSSPPRRGYTIPVYNTFSSTLPPPPPSDSDSLLTPQTPPNSAPKSSGSKTPLIILFLIILISWRVEHTTNTDRSAVRDSIRQQWALESQTHQNEMKRWDTERSAWAEQRVRWKEEEGKRELVRREWGLAVLRHQKWTERVEEQRAEWDLEAREHWRLKDSMDAQRKKWDQETRDRDIEHERRKVEDSDWQKRSQRRKDEMEERDKAGLFFSPLQKGKCTTFNTRRYRSELENLPRDFTGNVLRACMDTSAEINGRSVTPVYCEDLGSAGVWGIWEADGEVGCTPWWSRYKDKGCTAPESGLREIEQHLENLYPNESYDWRDVCGTTPASFGGRNFAGPTNCVNWGSYDKPNLFGYWRILDETC